jgi:acyl carrier protein
MNNSVDLDIETQINLQIASLHRDISKISLQITIIKIIKHLVKDWGIEYYDITPKTKLKADLNLDSIEIINLIVSIEEYCQRKLDFTQLLTQCEEYIEDISVAALVEFVEQKPNKLTNNAELLVADP